VHQGSIYDFKKVIDLDFTKSITYASNNKRQRDHTLVFEACKLEKVHIPQKGKEFSFASLLTK